MRKISWLFCSLAVAWPSLQEARSAAPLDLEWSMELSWVKISEHYPFTQGKKYLLMAARNEFAPVQVILDVTPIRGTSTKLPVCIETNDIYQDGDRMYSDDDKLVRVFRQAPVDVVGRSARDSVPGVYFDPLIPLGDWEFPSIKDGSTAVGRRPAGAEVIRLDDVDIVESRGGVALAVFWIDVFVPRNAAGGIYETVVRLTAGCDDEEVQPTEVELKVAIASFDIPSTSSLPTMFQWHMDAACDASFPDRQGNCSGADLAPISDLYGRFMLEHRVTLRLDPGNRPDVGAYVSFMRPFVEGTVDFYHPEILPGARVTSITFPWNQINSNYSEQVMGPHMDQWKTALDSEGASWSDLALHKVGDEPPGIDPWTGDGSVESQAEIANLVGVPAFLTADVTHVTNEEPSLLTRNLLQILVPNVVRLDHWDDSGQYHGERRSDYGDFISDGGVVWSYQSCASHGCECDAGVTSCLRGGQECEANDPSCSGDELGDGRGWPTLTVDAWGLQNRAEPWLSFIYSFDDEGEPPPATPFLRGIHYYDVVGWEGIATDPSPASPYRKSNLYRHGGNGDGQLLYPGNAHHLGGSHNFPVASFRLKQIREGLEEYEWLLRCHANDPSESLNVAKKIFPSHPVVGSSRVTGSMYGFTDGFSEMGKAEQFRLERIRLWRCIEGTEPAATGYSLGG